MRHTEFWDRLDHVLGRAYSRSWAELTVLRRQKGETRDDLKLAAWFSGDEGTKAREWV